jgi:hypothetical protein
MAKMRTIGRRAWRLTIALLLSAAFIHGAGSQDAREDIAADSDQDGMSDRMEQALLVQFAPRFMVGRHDCSKLPATFVQNAATPTVEAEDGTIYGQVFPAKPVDGDLPAAEIHFYHLWASDCGPHGHRLDAEHVSVLVSASVRSADTANWKAIYWYAAAHEDTVCDVSQITRASTLHAEQSGAQVFVSPDKHASFLNDQLCRGGCGADRCVDMVALHAGRIVNLGEASHPMNGSVFIASAEWPLLGKMQSTDFPPEPVARLNTMPDTDIAWFNAGKHPAQGIIAVSNTTGQAIALGANDTSASLSKASASTDAALTVAQDNTGSALHKSFMNTVHALAVSARHVGEALSPNKKNEKP